MELKVWVEGIQRIVCGVTEATTCQDVVFALAHATAQSGRFTLVERWRNNERFLAPFENPLTILMKWGEYASDVQLILRRSNTDNKQLVQQNPPTFSRSLYNTRTNGIVQGTALDQLVNNRSHENGNNSASPSHGSPEMLKRNRDIRKSLTFSGHHGTVTDNINADVQMENIAVVQPTMQSKMRETHGRKLNKSMESPTSNENLSQKKIREVPPYRDPPGPDSSPLRTLPPYRDPPPPVVTSPTRPQSYENSISESSYGHSKDESTGNMSKLKQRNQEVHDVAKSPSGKISQTPNNMVTVAYTQRYAELIRLVNKQRDTISSQQVDLTKLDAEILYWENKNREHFNQIDFISQEINRIESNGRIIEDQINDLIHTEEESEIVRQQEKTLKSEITLLRSKLANCETELLQCKNKIRLVMEEVSMEQHSMNRESEERMLMERKVINEMERLQHELEQAKRLTDLTNQSSESLKQEVSNIESAIVDKKQQVERLVADMKEANLQSLTVACQEEQIKNLVKATQKPGSTRKIIGSPRQLENAVPTSKNPHGVWV